jgi:hypothetical protein
MSTPAPKRRHFISSECSTLMKGGFYGIKCSGTAADRIQQVLKAGVFRLCADIRIQSFRAEEMSHG